MKTSEPRYLPALSLLKLGVLVCLVLSTSLAQATFKPREDRWAQQIQETLLIGEATWLETKVTQETPSKDTRQARCLLSKNPVNPTPTLSRPLNKGRERSGECSLNNELISNNKDIKFFSIYTAATQAKPRGAVLILHGMDENPDWPEVISPLRRVLTDHGWSTLAIQMPVLPGGAPLIAFGPIFDESPARIRAGIKFLHGKGIKHIVLIGHDMGAAIGAAFLAQEPSDAIDGFVGIAMRVPVLVTTVKKLDPRVYTPNSLQRLTLPVLDLYGGLDQANITDSAPLRLAAAKKARNRHYEQVRIPDADHFFNGHEKELLEEVTRWLDKRRPLNKL